MSLDSIQINGISILMPSTHGWITPQSLGTGGTGAEVIPGIYKYSLNWDLMTSLDFSEVYNIWRNNQNSNITAYLPILGDASYTHKLYTCRISPVIYQGFIEGSYASVKTELVGIDITS